MDERLIKSSDHIADMEAMRKRVLQQLVSQVDLLDDSLYAMRNGSPLAAEGFLYKAIVAIREEISNLRNLNK